MRPMSIYEKAMLPGEDRLTGALELAPVKEGEKRRFHMKAYTGTDVDRLFGKAIFDLSAVQLPPSGKLPILLNHDENKVVGYADTIQMGDEIVLSGTLSQATEYGREVAALADDGFPWQASIGIKVMKWTELPEGETLTVNGRECKGPMYIGSETRLLESSFVPAGADHNTRAVALTTFQPESEEAPVAETNPEPEVDLSATQALTEQLAALQAEIAELKQEKAVRHPGVGFSPAEAQEPQRPQNLAQVWESNLELRSEFFHKPEMFAAWAERHPDEAQRLMERA